MELTVAQKNELATRLVEAQQSDDYGSFNDLVRQLRLTQKDLLDNFPAINQAGIDEQISLGAVVPTARPAAVTYTTQQVTKAIQDAIAAGFTVQQAKMGAMTNFGLSENDFNKALDQVDTSNLCLEVNHPLIPIYDVNDPTGEIGVCVLAALNWLEIKDDNEMENVCDIIVRMLDALIDHQEYFVPGAKNFATKRRSLGVGVSNLAALLAKEGLKYWDTKAPNFVARWMEKTSYYF